MAESAPPSKSWTAGEVIAEKYVLIKPVAKGGMGSVWVAQNTLTERRVAIKFMLPELASSPETIQRFFREAKASARIDHPSIVDVLDLGTLPDGAPFLVMELLEGRSLEKIIDTAPLSPLQAAAIMLDVARALSNAHAAGIVHRDLKPANVFVARKGELVIPKILDFGISKIVTSASDIRMTRTGAVLGSPAYMSPEQARGRSDIDGRADIWACGIILYEAVSGRLPFVGENYNQVMMAITLDPPIPLQEAAANVDKDYLAIVDMCLQKDREQRPPTMESLATMLDVYVQARAALGIPPFDLGEAGAPRSARIGSTHRLASQVFPRTGPSSRPPPAPETADTQRSDPVQMTVNAVTVIDRPPKSADPRRTTASRTRFPVVAVLGLLAASAIGVLTWMFVGRKETRVDHAPSSTQATQTTTNAAPPTSTSSDDIAPPEPSTTTSTTSTTTIAAESSTASASPPPSASAPATKSSEEKPTHLLKPKPPLVPKPKPSAKPSTSSTSTDDGPASVGNGPGF